MSEPPPPLMLSSSFLASFQYVSCARFYAQSTRPDIMVRSWTLLWLTFLFSAAAAMLLALPQPPNDHLPSTPHPVVVSCRWEMLLSPVNQPPPHKIDKEAPRLSPTPTTTHPCLWRAHSSLLCFFIHTQFFLASLRRLRSVDWRLSMMVYCFIYAISAMSHVARSSHWLSFFSSGLNFSKSTTNKEKEKWKILPSTSLLQWSHKEGRWLINNSIIVWKLRTKPSILLRSERTR